MNKKLKYTAAAIAVLTAAIYINNTNHLAAHREGKPVFLAHRGIAQRFDERDLKNDTCTARRNAAAGPSSIWRTRSNRCGPALRPAPTSSSSTFIPRPMASSRCFMTGRWTCRTDGQGVTREHSMAYLKKLDIGHGYTADGGKTFSVSRQGHRPDADARRSAGGLSGTAAIDQCKEPRPFRGEKLAAVLNKLPAERRAQIMVYGGDEPVEMVRQRASDIRTISRAAIKSCLLGYIGYGWSGVVPKACQQRDGAAAGQRRSVDVGLA